MINVKKLSDNLSDFRYQLGDYLILLQQKKELLTAEQQYEQAADVERILSKVKCVIERMNELQSNLPNSPAD
jgi:hypothetical protein